MTSRVGGEIGEVGKKNSTVEELRAYLDGYRARSRSRGAGRDGHQQDLRPDRHQPRRRAAPRRRRRRGQARLRRPARARRGRARELRPGGRGPARRLDAARRAVPPLPGGRDGARSTSRPASRTRSTTTPRSPPALQRRDLRVAARRTPPTSARTARPTSSSCTRRARRRSGRSSARCGTCPTKDEILASAERQVRVPVHRAARDRLGGAGPAARPAGHAVAADPGRAQAPRSRRGDRPPGPRSGPGEPFPVTIRLEGPATSRGPGRQPRRVPGARGGGDHRRHPGRGSRGLALAGRGRGPGRSPTAWWSGPCCCPRPVEDDAGTVLATALAIGPVAVLPELQRRGSARPDGRGDGLAIARGVPALVLLGHRLLPAVRLRAGARRRAPAADRQVADRSWLRRLPAWDDDFRGRVRYPRRSSRSPSRAAAVAAAAGGMGLPEDAPDGHAPRSTSRDPFSPETPSTPATTPATRSSAACSRRRSGRSTCS